jgi:hypothetical protein
MNTVFKFAILISVNLLSIRSKTDFNKKESTNESEIAKSIYRNYLPNRALITNVNGFIA